MVTALHDRRQAEHLADLAERALLAEVELSPKPGLVDPLSCGAHDDMDVHTFLASIAAMRPWFPVFHETGRAGHRDGRRAFVARLRGPGQACEDAMFAATGGVNTHKGAVFAFGLLLGCAGRLSAAGEPVTVASLSHMTARMASTIVGQELGHLGRPRTYGERAYADHGLTGARGEAASGYRSVVDVALPAYHQVLARTGREDLALLQALLELMAGTDDTTLVKTGSLQGMRHVQARARELLQVGGALAPDITARVVALDEDLSARQLSPGGCADLLAVTAFFARLDR
ncbi:hypothetical protein ADJ73_13975 [Arsenicicoccus sp. oral taxon 190]|nr:hypothetical protein ADJ73_13975 [Arsenicicoccus sp. oral taxon 190]